MMKIKKSGCFLFLLLVIGVMPAYPHGPVVRFSMISLGVLYLILIFGKMVKFNYDILSKLLQGMVDPGVEETVESKNWFGSMLLAKTLVL
jgi:hypothetical protein